jgi:hypothetical protein
VQNVRDLWNGDNNREINSALENHAREGHLIKSDFGWSSPAQLTPLFEKYSGAQDTCPKQQPGVAQR